MTGNDLINSSLRLAGVLQSGEIPSPEESQDALLILNQMLDAWSADRLMIYTVTRDGPYNLTPGQQTYYLGPQGGPFQLAPIRPPKVTGYGVIILTNPVQPLELEMEYLTYDTWKIIPVKNLPSAYPLKVWDDNGYPFRTLQVYPVPTASCQIVAYDWNALAQFTDLYQNVIFPPAYAEALRYNLAVRLAPEFDVAQLNPLVLATAIDSKAKIEAMNAPTLDLRCDPMLVSPRSQLYNWIADTWVRRN